VKLSYEEAEELLEATPYNFDVKGDFVVGVIDIFKKYNKDSDTVILCAEHDVVYSFRYPEDGMDKEDILTMYSFGWHLDSDNDGWAKFV